MSGPACLELLGIRARGESRALDCKAGFSGEITDWIPVTIPVASFAQVKILARHTLVSHTKNRRVARGALAGMSIVLLCAVGQDWLKKLRD